MLQKEKVLSKSLASLIPYTPQLSISCSLLSLYLWGATLPPVGSVPGLGKKCHIQNKQPLGGKPSRASATVTVRATRSESERLRGTRPAPGARTVSALEEAWQRSQCCTPAPSLASLALCRPSAGHGKRIWRQRKGWPHPAGWLGEPGVYTRSQLKLGLVLHSELPNCRSQNRLALHGAALVAGPPGLRCFARQTRRSWGLKLVTSPFPSGPAQLVFL